MNDEPEFRRAAPVLAALDMDKAVACYEQKPGFTKILQSEEPYAILRRDSVHIHLWAVMTDILPKTPVAISM